jgi:hypothetical protein
MSKESEITMDVPKYFRDIILKELAPFESSPKKIKCLPFGEFTVNELTKNINEDTQLGRVFVFQLWCKWLEVRDKRDGIAEFVGKVVK